MTAAEDRREELEAYLWKIKVPAPLVAKILARADAYAKASRLRAPKKPAGAPKPPAVHFPASRGRTQCCPGDFSPSNWQVTSDPEAVTCGHCRKTAAWREAGEAS